MNVPVLRTKPGFTLHPNPPPGGFRILSALDAASKVLAADLELTAGTNDHETGPHARGEAIDVSVRSLTVPMILRLKSYLEQVLGPHFTVLYETPSTPTDPQLAAIAYLNKDATGVHVHVQVKKGDLYPPAIEGVRV